MPVEITLPVFVRVGTTEACWGTVRTTATDGTVDEVVLRRELADFLRSAADCLETPAADDDREVPDAAP
ncbi:hypothetical protein [Streptomyces sp. NPDC017941]|uniref:hypothetical protein n=1 Tax=Streptomyces sp. NPDC017941 TaxID=3365018 RepID=UPI00378B49C5